MQSTSHLSASYRARPSPRRRAGSLGLALLTVALLIWMLLGLGVLPFHEPQPPVRPNTFRLLPGPPVAAAAKRSAARERQASRGAPPRPAQATPVTRPPTPPVPSAVAADWPPGVMRLDHATFAAADIGKLPSHADGAGSDQGKGDADGTATASAAGKGDGPGGARLYSAQWYREPSEAELATYLPRGGAPVGWGEIACRTIDRYHVDDCRELGESPAGSGLSRALRQAAWQFQVLPPRIGGKQMVGTWVRIHFDFTQRAAP